MTEKELLVKEENAVSGNPDTDITIQRCPHDEDNPYTMVHNELIRDASISPECRWLIIYLLSNKANWTINIQQIVNHLKGMTGRDRVYEIISEAIEAGYMKRDIVKKGNLKQQIKYFVSEKPKFKKSLRHPEIQDTESRDTENQGIKNKHTSKNKYPEEGTLTPPIPPQPQEEIAKAIAAKAAEEILKDSSKEKPKRTRTPSEFSPKVKEVGDKMINALVRNKPNYVPPRNLAPFLTHVDYLLRLDKRDPTLLIDVFSWAIADSFWCDKMYKPNPAEYLRKQFDQLEMKMNAKPAPKDRKFAPSSNDARSLEKMQEWEKSAL